MEWNTVGAGWYVHVRCGTNRTESLLSTDRYRSLRFSAVGQVVVLLDGAGEELRLRLAEVFERRRPADVQFVGELLAADPPRPLEVSLLESARDDLELPVGEHRFRLVELRKRPA